MSNTEQKETLAWNDELNRLVVVNKAMLEQEVLLPIEEVKPDTIVMAEVPRKVESDPIPVEDDSLSGLFDGGDDLDSEDLEFEYEEDDDEEDDYW